jgi:hypothetical protein
MPVFLSKSGRFSYQCVAQQLICTEADSGAIAHCYFSLDKIVTEAEPVAATDGGRDAGFSERNISARGRRC